MARIVLGITGGIAAYKTPQLVRDLRAAGHEVRVVLTRSASHFVSELSLATVSGHPVRNALFELDQEAQIGHIELARWPDQILVAPATADLLARSAQGRCDDLLTTVLLASRAPVLMAPAMNAQMWAHPATRQNVATLVQRGVQIIAPESGLLACGEQGVGKMAALSAIVDALDAPRAKDWNNKRVVVTAGPTREALDAVRFISNPSTGKMGFALAQAAASRGARVELVSGPVHLETPWGVQRHEVQSGEDMYMCTKALLEAERADWVFKVAAVADLRLSDAADAQKKSKAQWLAQPWQFEGTRDLLADLVAQFSGRTRFLGFAAQTAVDKGDQDPRTQVLAKAREKLERKGCDAIFVNRVGVSGSGFGSATNGGYLLQASTQDVVELGASSPMQKLQLAHRILDLLAEPA